jgi:hypothetical protein
VSAVEDSLGTREDENSIGKMYNTLYTGLAPEIERDCNRVIALTFLVNDVSRSRDARLNLPEISTTDRELPEFGRLVT